MSQEQRVEVVRSWLASFVDDPDAFRGLLHTDIVWFPFEDNHTPSHGIDAGMLIRNEWVDAWEEMEAAVEDVVEEGEDIVASIHVTGRGKASGVEVDVRLHLHFRVRDAKVVYVFEYEDRAAALAAVGVSE
jgi:ketosteroid isomerase-like protein